MNSPALGDEYEELCTFANVEYTPAWYYKKFPGFYNVECYRILAGWTQGVRRENEQENKKRKIENVEEEGGVEETKGESEDGVHS